MIRRMQLVGEAGRSSLSMENNFFPNDCQCQRMDQVLHNGSVSYRISDW